MKEIQEITVLVNSDYENLHRLLTNKGFNILEEYWLNDIYMLPNNIEIKKGSELDIFKYFVLIREIGDYKKTLLYKHKVFSESGDILEQRDTECVIKNIEEALSFMEAIGYKKAFEIRDRIIVYSNGIFEMAVQLVNDKYVFIEMENNSMHLHKHFDSIEDMIAIFKNIGIDYDESNYFAKKALLVLKDTSK